MPTKTAAKMAKKVASPAKKAVAVKSNNHKMTGAKKGLIAAGLVAGAALGVATAYYLNTPKGKKMLQDAEKKAKELQKRLMKELSKTSKLTKERYVEIVEKLLAYYSKTKELSANELPEIRDYLLSKYSQISKEFKAVK